MKIAIAGATGRIGSLTTTALERDGHEVVAISRSSGIDLTIGTGLTDALTGVDAVIDTLSFEGATFDGVVSSFATSTTNLLRAEAEAGVGHHVLLSIVRVNEHANASPHHRGKVVQESLVATGPVPWTIVPATQFHDFPEMVSTWSEANGSAVVAPQLLQPVAPAEVADVLAEVAIGQPQGRYRDVAGPATEDLVDLARRTRAARGTSIRLVPSWQGNTELSGDALLPGPGARIMPTTFDEWLAAETA